MKMEELNKTQLILLALLLSFVTSIATGIVTVTLLEQAPPGITQTINRIVERTIETVVPGEDGKIITQTVVVKEENYIVDATEKNQGNIVKVGYIKQDTFNFGTLGSEGDIEDSIKYIATGFIVSSDGFVVIDKTSLPNKEEIIIKTINSEYFNVGVADNTHEYLTLLKVSGVLGSEEEDEPSVVEFNKPTFIGSSFVKVGQTGISLGFDKGILLLLGIISQIDINVPEDESGESEYIYKIYTTVNLDKRYSGGPMINTDGKVIGVSIVGKDGDSFVVSAHEIMKLLKAQDINDDVALGKVSDI